MILHPHFKKCTLLFICVLFCLNTFSQRPNINELLAKLSTDKDTMLVNSYIKVVRYYSFQGKNDSAEYYLKKAWDLSKEIKFDKGLGLTAFRLGEFYLTISNYSKAMEYLVMAEPLLGKANMQARIPLVKRDIGLAYYLQGEYKDALPYFKEAEAGLLKYKDSANLVGLYTDIGTCLGDLGDTTAALKYLNDGMAISLKQYEQLIYFKTAMPPEQFEGTNNRLLDVIVNAAYNSIDFLKTNEQFNGLLSKVDKIKAGIENGNNDNFKFRLLTIYTRLNFLSKQYDKAIGFGEAAMKSPIIDEYPLLKSDITWALTNSYAAVQNYEASHKYFMQYNTIKDTIYNANKLEAVKKIETKYETNKKEEQIAVLKNEKRNQNIIMGLGLGALAIALGLLLFASRSKKLQKKLFQKEQEIQKKEMETKLFELEQTALRAQMNPHFIFNCLNSVQRYVIKNDTEGVNHYLSTFANLIRQTLENSGKSVISLKEEIKYLDTYIKLEQLRSNNSFDYTIDIPENIDTDHMFIPNMIIQPYVENSIQHGMHNNANERGYVFVSFSTLQKLVCVIDDNGMGIKHRALVNKNDNHESMGTSITEKRIAMYNSLHKENIKLQVTDKSETNTTISGTRITLEFPISSY
jgi:tetratricopeptide (TPR) repeat protein